MAIIHLVRRSVLGLLTIPAVRILVGKIRYYYYTKLRRNLRIIGSEYAFDETVQHNMRRLAIFGNTRIDKIIKPISIIETLNPKSKILVVGPRNEDDLLNLVGNGFSLRNIQGLDLISYSPHIQIGDMHSMPYVDSSFDAIISGWTLSYSRDPHRFAREVVRVAKPGAIVGIAVEYGTLSDEAARTLLGGYVIAPKDFARINNTEAILKLFDSHVMHIYFNHDAPNRISHSADGLNPRVSSVVVIFSLQK